MTSFAQWKAQGQVFKYRSFDIYFWHEAIQNTATQKPYLLLLHGYPTASWDWHKIWDELAQDYNLITFDYLGFGCSDKPKHHDYNTSEQANICETLLDSLDISSCFVLAHDYGDTVLQELLARQNAGRNTFSIKAAAMLNGGIFQGVYKPILIQRVMISSLGNVLAFLNNKFIFAKNFQSILVKKYSKDEMSQTWQMVCNNQGRTLMPKLQRYIFERIKYQERWSNALINSPCPLMYICGENDPISGKHMREHYEKLVPNPQTVALDNVGHYPQTESPLHVLEHSLVFFKQHL